jgi:propanol-preferring alcohol dehydrogenase
MLLTAVGRPVREAEVPDPVPGSGQLLIRVHACGVCRTDLHVIDGELPNPKLPLIPGHQIVGTVVATGAGVTRFVVGDRVGVPWLAFACGECRYCRSRRENLCDRAQFTGYQVDGGYAELTVARESFSFAVPEPYSDPQAAPLMCAGLIGYRALSMTGDAERIGLYGFGAAGHIIAQVARFQGRRVFAFTRAGDEDGQSFARALGAEWAGDSVQPPPQELDAAIIFAPVGELVPVALRAVARGGTVVCAGIHMSDIPSFPYALLWGERHLRSVANLTRGDAREFLALAARTFLRTEVEILPLAAANEALDRLRSGRIRGAAVLVPPGAPSTRISTTATGAAVVDATPRSGAGDSEGRAVRAAAPADQLSAVEVGVPAILHVSAQPGPGNSDGGGFDPGPGVPRADAPLSRPA